MYLIAGLGNPGEKYEGTRHNVGFAVIDELEAKHHIPVQSKEHKALVGRGIIGGEKVLLVKPQTFMNLSGDAIAEIAAYYKSPAEEVLVIFDDISLPVGQLRLRQKGSAGGHNGIKSIIARLGSENFPRIKVGVGDKPAQMDLADHVLGHVHGEEKSAIADGILGASKAVEVFLTDGMSEAMNRYNKKKA